MGILFQMAHELLLEDELAGTSGSIARWPAVGG